MVALTADGRPIRSLMVALTADGRPIRSLMIFQTAGVRPTKRLMIALTADVRLTRRHRPDGIFDFHKEIRSRRGGMAAPSKGWPVVEHCSPVVGKTA